MNGTTRRLFTLFAALACVLSAQAQGADDYPSRPVKIVVPFPAGGGADALGRIIADGLQRRLGRPFVVDNKPGANGNLGMEFVANSPADGYTLIFSSSGTWVVNPSLYSSKFDILKSFAPVMHVTTSPGVLAVTNSLPVTDVAGLIALAKSQPGKLNYGSAGMGGFGHVSGAMLTLMTGTQMTHVPYKGAAPANMDAIGGQVQVIFNDLTSVMPHLRAGKLRPIAVTTLGRHPSLPDLPSLDEAGVKGFENAAWSGIAAPAGTPAPVIMKLNREIKALLAEPDVIAKLNFLGASPVGSTPEQFGAYLAREISRFARIVKDAHITAQ